MAIIRHFELAQLTGEARHTEATASYSLVKEADGVKYLQLDTYGSRVRKLKGKKSQSIRLSPEAVAELKNILERHF